MRVGATILKTATKTRQVYIWLSCVGCELTFVTCEVLALDTQQTCPSYSFGTDPGPQFSRPKLGMLVCSLSTLSPGADVMEA
jgi:hypothetical protein